jgi:hypothetical protein
LDLHGPWWATVSAGPSQKSSLLGSPPPMLPVGSGLSAKSGVPGSPALFVMPPLYATPRLVSAAASGGLRGSEGDVASMRAETNPRDLCYGAFA